MAKQAKVQVVSVYLSCPYCEEALETPEGLSYQWSASEWPSNQKRK
jgi:hypothetical protein